MNSAFKMAREYGVGIEYADLGDWGIDELRSEYDPKGPTIRINIRVIENLAVEEMGEFITFAIGHELYHHLEACGEVERIAESREREMAANAFARELLATA